LMLVFIKKNQGKRERDVWCTIGGVGVKVGVP